MASATILAVVAILLVLQPTSAISDFLSPLLSPILDDICKDVTCGKGSCKTSIKYHLGYICECQPGWKQTRHHDDDDLKFLPCVIPNCTLDYSCTKAPASAPEQDNPVNKSFFDPCNWIYCGEGSCNRTSKLKHKCECNEGYSNILNVTTFPCFKDCTLGADCESLGISVSNKSTSVSSPNLSANGKNKGSSVLPGSFSWLLISVMSMAMVLWR